MKLLSLSKEEEERMLSNDRKEDKNSRFKQQVQKELSVRNLH